MKRLAVSRFHQGSLEEIFSKCPGKQCTAINFAFLVWSTTHNATAVIDRRLDQILKEGTYKLIRNFSRTAFYWF